MKKIIEYCPYCEKEVKINATKHIEQICPNCKHIIRACSLCNCDIEDCNKCNEKEVGGDK